MRLEPVIPEKVSMDDPFYALGLVADNSAGSLSNAAMDKLVYET